MISIQQFLLKSNIIKQTTLLRHNFGLTKVYSRRFNLCKMTNATNNPSIYPEVRRDLSVIEDYHGQKIMDPYRWLENPDSEETKAFVHDQNKLTQSFLSECKHRDRIRERITELWNYEKYSCPFKRGEWFYFFKNSGLQNQSVLYKQKTLESEAIEFLDPNKLSADGTTSLSSMKFSHDGKIFAYVISEKGSDWGKIKFKNVDTGEDYADVLENVKFSCLEWTMDNKGIFYNRYDRAIKADGTVIDKNEFQKLYYHYLGESQESDRLCASFDDANWMGHASVSDCGQYIIMTISASCEPTNQLWYCNLKDINSKIDGKLPFIRLINNFEAKYEYITNEATLFTLKTNLNALKYKLIKVDIARPEKSNWIEFIPEKSNMLQDVLCVNRNKLLINYLEDCRDKLFLHDLETGGTLHEFNNDIGTYLEINAKYDQDFFFFKFGSFTNPGDVYHVNLRENEYKPKLFKQSAFSGLDLSQFETKQVKYKSKDGTEIPMFLVSKKTLKKSATNPVYLYAYGGFNISLTPTFSVTRLIFLNHFDGIYACANVRGGGEYGEEWYNGGRLNKKQNTFDDFIAAAEYLVDNEYTSREKLVINGGSNGGLTVTASINQRPDLFQAAIADVAVCDMLRFHKFTIGSYWVSDYGCSEKKDDFECQIKYSPLHTIKENSRYPYVLMATADHDDRVVPSHSYKYIAELQYRNKTPKNLALIRIDTNAGHGAGKPTSKIIDEHSDKFGFISHVLDLKWID